MEEIIIREQKQLCDCSDQNQLQDIKQLADISFRTQQRRRDISLELVKTSKSQIHVDIGCAEGFITNALEETLPNVLAFDLNPDYLEKAKVGSLKTEYCRASVANLPLLDGSVDSISIFEVIEHLPMDVIHEGVTEMDRILRVGGSLFISVPYRQRINYERCQKCGKWKPDNEAWHLHTFDENVLNCLLPSNYQLIKVIKGPNFPLITCSKAFSRIPLYIWIPINKLVGCVRVGSRIFVKFVKCPEINDATVKKKRS